VTNEDIMIKVFKFLGTGLILAAFAMMAYSAFQQFSENAGSGGVIGGAYTLTDQNGHAVTDKTYLGRWQIVYFGYTHCPDACPTALNNIADALGDLGANAAKIVPIFVTIDPARDTKTVLKDYLANFGASFVGLTGSASAIAAAEQEYHVYAVKRPETNGDYEMDHSSVIYIMNPQGQFITNFTDQTDPGVMATKLKALMG